MPETNYIFLSAGTQVLADNPQWKNRFKFQSSSGKFYTIAQNAEHRHWGCSCTGWRMRRRCRHLEEFGIPNQEAPYEATLALRGLLSHQPIEARSPYPPEYVPRSRPHLRLRPKESVTVVTPPQPKVVDFSKLPKRQFSLDEDV